MPFAIKQHFKSCSSVYVPSYRTSSHDDDGRVTFTFKPSNTPLPDAINYDLKTQLRAGVPLKQVNSVLFNPVIGQKNTESSEV